jgi:hypothetical protein
MTYQQQRYREQRQNGSTDVEEDVRCAARQEAAIKCQDGDCDDAGQTSRL